MENEYFTTREQWRAAKRYTHMQFDAFCRALYSLGYQDGMDSVQGIALDDALQAVATVKGIGGARLEAVREALEKGMEGKANE